MWTFNLFSTRKISDFVFLISLSPLDLCISHFISTMCTPKEFGWEKFGAKSFKILSFMEVFEKRMWAWYLKKYLIVPFDILHKHYPSEGHELIRFWWWWLWNFLLKFDFKFFRNFVFLKMCVDYVAMLSKHSICITEFIFSIFACSSRLV